jgi:hypothetical protein
VPGVNTEMSVSFWWYWGLELRVLYLEPLHQSFLWWLFFWDRVARTIFPGWLQTAILLISASWVARIISVSHQHLNEKSDKPSTILGSKRHTYLLGFTLYKFLIFIINFYLINSS